MGLWSSCSTRQHRVASCQDVFLERELLVHQGCIRHEGQQDDRVDGPCRDGHTEGDGDEGVHERGVQAGARQLPLSHQEHGEGGHKEVARRSQGNPFQGPCRGREEGRVHEAGGRDRETPGLDSQGVGDTSEERGLLEVLRIRDDLIQIFEFIDDQRAESVRDVIIGDTEATDELIDKHASIMRIMENKKKTVEEFIVKGEKLMEDPKSPKFLETHVSKLKDAWEVAQQKAQERKDALADNLEAWKVFETKKVETVKSQDGADKLLKSIKRVYDLEKGPADLADKLKLAAAIRAEIEDFFSQTSKANDTLQIFLPAEMKDGMHGQVKVLKERLPVLDEIDKALAEIYKFNQDLADFDVTLTQTQEWCDGKAVEKITLIRTIPESLLPPDLEEKRVDMFPKEGAKMSKDAKDFLERLKKLRGTITDLDDQINKEFEKYSGDVRYFAEYQTGLQDFYPRLVEAEERITDGLV